MIPFPTIETLLKKHGNTAAGRAAGRQEIRVQIFREAERQARIAALSLRCKYGNHCGVYVDEHGETWPDGCRDDGSGCICECHDPAASPAPEEKP
jgi:hypothetical protein